MYKMPLFTSSTAVFKTVICCNIYLNASFFFRVDSSCFMRNIHFYQFSRINNMKSLFVRKRYPADVLLLPRCPRHFHIQITVL